MTSKEYYYSNAEIAQALGITKSEVNKAFNSGMEKLRELGVFDRGDLCD